MPKPKTQKKEIVSLSFLYGLRRWLFSRCCLCSRNISVSIRWEWNLTGTREWQSGQRGVCVMFRQQLGNKTTLASTKKQQTAIATATKRTSTTSSGNRNQQGQLMVVLLFQCIFVKALETFYIRIIHLYIEPITVIWLHIQNKFSHFTIINSVLYVNC